MDIAQKKLRKQKAIEKAIQEELIGLPISLIHPTYINTACFRPSFEPRKPENYPKTEYKTSIAMHSKENQIISEKKLDDNDDSANGNKRQKFNIRSFPQNAFGIVMAKKSEDDKVIWGSGIMIGPDLVLTAAPNVYDDEKPIRKKFPYIKFIPGMDREKVPFGEIEIEDVFVTESYITHTEESDESSLSVAGLAVMILKKPVGNETGYIGLHAVEAEHTYLLEDQDIFVAGYNRINGKSEGICEQLGDKGRTSELKELKGKKELIYYTCPSTITNGALCIQEKDEFHVIGMHVGKNENSDLACLITREKYQYFYQQIKEFKWKSIEQILQSKADKEGILKKLNLGPNSLSQLGLEVFLEYKLNALEEVDLSRCSIDGKGLADICNITEWKSLQRIDLSKYNSIGNNGCFILSCNQTWKNLKSLILKESKIRSDGIIKLVESQNWPELEEIHLSRNEIDDQGALAFASSTTWTKLKKIYLESNKIGPEGGAAIGNNVLWKDLEELSLSNNPIGDKGAISIGSNTSWNKLRILNLSHNKFGDEGAAAIGKNSTWTNLEVLSLMSNPIGDLGFKRIVSNPTWVNLSKINMKWNKMSEEVFAAMGENIVWKNLHELDLSRTRPGPKGAICLSSNSTWSNLRRLFFYGNEIKDEDGVAIAKNTAWRKLEVLMLMTNQLGPETAICLANNDSWKNLKCLDLKMNNIGDTGAAAIGKNTCWRNINTLVLSQNEIEDYGAIQIGKNTSWTNLRKLDLSGNRICDGSGVVLARNTTWKKLSALALHRNQIGWKTAVELGRNSKWKAIRGISLNGNLKLSRERLRALKTVLLMNPDIILKYFDLEEASAEI